MRMTSNSRLKVRRKESGLENPSLFWGGWGRTALQDKAQKQLSKLSMIGAFTRLKKLNATRTVMNRKPSQQFLLFQLPLELRLEIYDYLITLSDTSLSQPRQHPLYVLLFVSRALRSEIGAMFYRKPFFLFPSPDRCTSFFDATPHHVQFLTSLAISVPADRTESLEPVFRKLYLANAKLHRLAIYLKSPGGRFMEKQRIVTAYMLPRRLCVSPEGKGRIAHQTGLRFGGYYIVLDDSTENYVYEYEKHEPMSVKASKSCNAALGKMQDLRSIRVFGQPVGEAGLEFELAILKVCGRMREVAKVEGKEIVWGKYGSRARKDTWWWFEGWIEGEEEQEEKHW